MTRLVWDDPSSRHFTIGVDRGVLYIYNVGYAWNGLISVDEKPTSSSDTVGYYDGQKYIQQKSVEDFNLSIEAFTYPDRLDDHDGPVDLCYRTSLDKGYELHLVYNLMMYSKTGEYTTPKEEPKPVNFAWDGIAAPEQVAGIRATAHLIVNSINTPPVTLSALEDILYGIETIDPRLPDISEVTELFDANAIFRVIDNGDGTWTAIGPDSMIEMIDSTTYKITTPSITYITPTTYKIRSW